VSERKRAIPRTSISPLIVEGGAVMEPHGYSLILDLVALLSSWLGLFG
jgi:hypothetical protein